MFVKLLKLYNKSHILVFSYFYFNKKLSKNGKNIT